MLRVFEPAFEREHGNALRSQPVRFGARISLAAEERASIGLSLHAFTSAFHNLKNASLSIEEFLPQTSYPGEKTIGNELQDLNNTLNNILFEMMLSRALTTPAPERTIFSRNYEVCRVSYCNSASPGLIRRRLASHRYSPPTH